MNGSCPLPRQPGSLLVVVEGELIETHEGDGVGLANGMHAQVVQHTRGVVEADDIREAYECFLRVAGIAGGQVVHQPHPLAAQAGGVVAEMVNPGHCQVGEAGR